MIVIFKVLGMCLLAYLIMLVIGYQIAKRFRAATVKPEASVPSEFVFKPSDNYKLLEVVDNNHYIQVPIGNVKTTIQLYRTEQNVPTANILAFDSDKPEHRKVGQALLQKDDYIEKAEHFIAASYFETPDIVVLFPMKDWYYRSLINLPNDIQRI